MENAFRGFSFSVGSCAKSSTIKRKYFPYYQIDKFFYSTEIYIRDTYVNRIVILFST